MATTSELIDQLFHTIRSGNFTLGERAVGSGAAVGGMGAVRRDFIAIWELLRSLNADGGGGTCSKITEVIRPAPTEGGSLYDFSTSTEILNKKVLLNANDGDLPPGPCAVILPDPADLELGTEVIFETEFTFEVSFDEPIIFSPAIIGFLFPALNVEFVVPGGGGIQGYRTASLADPPVLLYKRPVIGDPEPGWLTIKLRVMESDVAGEGRKDWWYVSNDYDIPTGGVVEAE